jgi:transcriptional regulator with XRE-family HTH domain
MKTNTNELHFGEMLRKYIKTKRISKAALSRKMNIIDNTILRYEKSAALKSNHIFELSVAMEHNFFLDIAALLPKNYSTDAPIDTTLSDKIAQLEQRIMILEAEKAVLLLR